jgi:guanylate kinase
MSSPLPGLVVVVSGPSGVGKTTILAKLLEDPGYARSITATTRAPREGERDGVDYLFLPRGRFEEDIARGRFLEHATVHGNLYGTPRDGVEAVLAKGKSCLLNIDVQGAESLRRSGLPVVTVFLMPPSIEELEARLGKRGTEDPAEMRRRLEQARAEMAEADRFDRKIINHRLEDAVEQIRGFVAERRRRSA